MKKILFFLKKIFVKKKSLKIGTLKGVYLPNILQMIGVILFMRLGWILGNVGIVKMISIISMSSFILFITSLSMTSIVSNMKVGSGGAYYLISRQLGIEFGSAIGILLVIANHASIALCVSGFSVSIQEIFPSIPFVLIKVATLITLFFVSYFSRDFAMKTQLIIFLIIAVALTSLFLKNPNFNPAAFQIVNPTTLLSFWAAFSMFFPATTGIEAGMSFSGDLKNPSRSLAIGTIASVLTAYVLYSTVSLFLNKNLSLDLLRSNTMIAYHLSRVGFLIFFGIWGATLSSALGGILGAPRVIQSIAQDGMLPKFLSKGFGPTNQPRIATIIVFFFALVLTIFTNINQIIPMLTMACLVSYGLINFVAFFEQFIQNPSWRPSFRTHWSVSFVGFLGCFMAMFMINPGATFIVLAFTVALCFWTASRKVKGNWDDMRYSLFSFLVHKGATKLVDIEKNEKSWRPHILAIQDTATIQKNLAYFSHALNQEKGFLTFGLCIKPHLLSMLPSVNPSHLLKKELDIFKIPGYLHISPSDNYFLSVNQLIHNYGFGPIKPNTIILPLKSEHYLSDDFLNILIDANVNGKNIIFLKTDQDSNVFSDPKIKNKQINLWWKGDYKGNFELCLAFAHIMQFSKLWSSTKICIKSILKNEVSRIKLLEHFEKYEQKVRIKNLSFSPIVDPNLEFFTNFQKFSKDADLTFLGMRKFTPEMTKEEYKQYYLQLFENTKNLKNIAYVLSAENLQFEKIFS